MMKRAWIAGLFLVTLAACGGGDGDGGADTLAPEDTAGEETAPPCEEGQPCDDGDPCTGPDLCADGVCVPGEEAECTQYVCAEVACDGAGGCTEPAVKPGWCLIDGLCVQDGAESPDNSCRVCEAPGTEWVVAEVGSPCEDGNICTENDYCDNGACLAGSPPTCADGIPCTEDVCDEYDGCIHTPMHEECMDDSACTEDLCSIEDGGCVNVPDDELPCSDQNVCTTNDHCSDGLCVSDPEPLDCDDENFCTDEFCHESYGCVYTFNELDCNDGAACTSDDICSFGQCIGEDPWNQCPPCEMTFSEHAQKISKLEVGIGGVPGQALNVDGDLKSCSPSESCQDGLDNALSFAGEFINPTIKAGMTLEDDTLIWLAELVEPQYDGTEFLLNLYYGSPDPEQGPCDIMTETCNYYTPSANFNAICQPQIAFPNAVIEDGLLIAGGSGFIFPIKMYFVGGTSATLVLYSARLQAQVDMDGDTITSLSGVMGGAVTKDDIQALVEAVPEEYFPGGAKGLILSMIPALNNDIDLDGDGTPDGLSIGMVFETIPGVILDYAF